MQVSVVIFSPFCVFPAPPPPSFRVCDTCQCSKLGKCVRPDQVVDGNTNHRTEHFVKRKGPVAADFKVSSCSDHRPSPRSTSGGLIFIQFHYLDSSVEAVRLLRRFLQTVSSKLIHFGRSLNGNHQFFLLFFFIVSRVGNFFPSNDPCCPTVLNLNCTIRLRRDSKVDHLVASPARSFRCRDESLVSETKTRNHSFSLCDIT